MDDLIDDLLDEPAILADDLAHQAAGDLAQAALTIRLGRGIGWGRCGTKTRRTS